MQIPDFCSRFKDCKKHDPYLAQETDAAWVFQCKTCHRVQVLTKDKIKEQARYERMVGQYRPKHSWDTPKMTFHYARGNKK